MSIAIQSDPRTEPAHEPSIQESFIKYPPFPDAPEGVKIVPFKLFKECGIQILSADDGEEVEVDGLGIPTVELRVKHNTDQCKTNSSKKKKKKTTSNAQDGVDSPARKKEWWELWEEGEDFRVTTYYNPNDSRASRVHDAATEFKTGRKWPPAPSSVHELWDQFRLFVGLLGNPPIWRKADKNHQENKPANDSGEDSDFEDVPPPGVELEMDDAHEFTPHTKRPRPRPPYLREYVELKDDETIKKVYTDATAVKEDKMDSFLNDTEKNMKIFLSSYMRKQGLIWADRNLTNVPRIVGFFLSFLLRNRVLPEPTHERGLQRALALTELAKIELPLTAKVARALPDDFSEACKALWGRKSAGYTVFAAPDAGDEGEEPKNKRRRISDGYLGQKMNVDEDSEAKESAEAFEAELKAANVEVFKPGVDITMKEFTAENKDEKPNEFTSSWGTQEGQGNWGSEEAGSGDWGTSEDPWATPSLAAWTPTVYSLLPLLGPTALPLTHTTGVVECSLRKIKAIIPPSTTPPNPNQALAVSSTTDGGCVADAVEAELERQFARVVLEPWIHWDGTDDGDRLAHPQILESSRGAVVSSDPAAPAANFRSNGTSAHAHDPLKDDVVLLVTPEVLPNMLLGMGLGATWIQIARKEDLDLEGGVQPQGENKKKSKGKKRSRERYWYLEELMTSLPSFYTV